MKRRKPPQPKPKQLPPAWAPSGERVIGGIDDAVSNGEHSMDAFIEKFARDYGRDQKKKS